MSHGRVVRMDKPLDVVIPGDRADVLHDILVEDGGVKFGEHGIGCFVVSEDVAAVTVSAPK